MAYLRAVGFSFLFLWASVCLFVRPAVAGSDEVYQRDAVMLPRVDAGVRYMLDGYHDRAIAIFTELEKEFPDSPAGPLRKAEAIWWKIFRTEGALDRLHEMDVLKSKNPPFEKEFHAAANKAIQLAEALVKKYKNSAQAYFYLGTANGLKSQMEGGKDNMIASARFAKKMKQNLDKCLSLNANFYDAYLEEGLYNYYIGSLPPVLRTLKFTLGLPSGDKVKGIELLKIAKDKGGFLGSEAKFYLASIYLSPDQKKYNEAVALVGELHRDYPNNPTFHLLLGYVYEKSGKREQARAVYDDVILRAQRKHENYDESIARQASTP